MLHHFQMVHCDIKCDNIGWSKTKWKYVILDYGFAGFISEQKGYKTLTKFRGTREYCSEEMQKTYFLKEPLHVDLYYNDLMGVQKSEFEQLPALFIKDPKKVPSAQLSP